MTSPPNLPGFYPAVYWQKPEECSESLNQPLLSDQAFKPCKQDRIGTLEANHKSLHRGIEN